MSTMPAQTPPPSNFLDDPQQLERILQTLRAAVIQLSWEGKILQVNEGFCQLTGFGLEEVRDRHIGSALMPADELRLFTEAMLQLREGMRHVTFETYVLKKHGERRRFSWSATTLDPADGQAGAVLLTGMDITEAHLAKKELVRLRAELKQLRRDEEARSTSREYSPSKGLERRRGQRRSCHHPLWVAPMVGDELPPRASFRQVQGTDISTSGFCYMTAEAPDTEQVVLQVGKDPYRVDLVARVAHVTSIIYESKPMYLVGCQFLRRVAY